MSEPVAVRRIAGAVRAVAESQPGRRNDTLTRCAALAYRLAAVAGLAADDAVTAPMTEAATAAGLAAREVSATLRSARRMAAEDPHRGVHDRPTGGGGDDVKEDRVDDVLTLDLTGATTADAAAAVPDGSDGRRPWVDLSALLASDELPDPEPPDVCRRDDGVGLFYRGTINGLFGDPESGKTWVAYAAVAEVLAADDGTGVVFDLDHNGTADVARRLLLLGAPREALADPARFRLYSPDDVAALAEAVKDAVSLAPHVAVVDSIGELLPLMGATSKDADDVTQAYRKALQPLANAGAAVVTVDHLARNSESRRQGPTGSLAKSRPMRGALLRVQPDVQPVPGRTGLLRLSVKKDSRGGLRSRSAAAPGKSEPDAGVFVLEPVRAGDASSPLRWRVETDGTGGGGSTSPGVAVTTGETGKVSDRLLVEAVRDAPGCSTRTVAEAVGLHHSSAGKRLERLASGATPQVVNLSDGRGAKWWTVGADAED